MTTKMTRSIISFIAVAVTLCCIVNAYAFPWSGSCDDNLTWTLTDDGVLTIDGQGKMRTKIANQPWLSLRSSIKSVVISDGVLSVGEFAFCDCTNMTSVTIGGSVSSIGNRAFAGCYGLKSIFIPGNVRDIESCAFSGCDGLTSITIGNGTKNIRVNAFDACSSLTKIEIPASVSFMEYGTFRRCDSLTDVFYGGTRAQWAALNISKNGNEALFNATIHYNDPDPIRVESVALSLKNLGIYVDSTHTLIATVTPSNAENKAMKWSSSDSSVASVDGNGNVRAIRPGTATITATAEDGGKSASCIVTVMGAGSSGGSSSASANNSGKGSSGSGGMNAGGVKVNENSASSEMSNGSGNANADGVNNANGLPGEGIGNDAGGKEENAENNGVNKSNAEKSGNAAVYVVLSIIAVIALAAAGWIYYRKRRGK